MRSFAARQSWLCPCVQEVVHVASFEATFFDCMRRALHGRLKAALQNAVAPAEAGHANWVKCGAQ
eukprot:8458226-Pyramimonas_sp.AAC.1